MVDDLHRALEAGDFELAAQLNAVLSQEAFRRAYLAMQAWQTMRDPETGLVPKSTHPRLAYWDPEDVAADLFPFFLFTVQYVGLSCSYLCVETLPVYLCTVASLPLFL